MENRIGMKDKRMEIKERISLLLEEMNRGVYEKEVEVGLSLLAALAGGEYLTVGSSRSSQIYGGSAVEESFCKCPGV